MWFDKVIETKSKKWGKERLELWKNALAIGVKSLDVSLNERSIVFIELHIPD